MTIDLFTEAARDVEAERTAVRCALAKVAVADLWPFLALAQGTEEFGHRLALAEESIADRVEPDMLDFTVAALKADFAELQTLRHAEAEHERVTAAVQVTAADVRPGEQIWHVDRQEWISVSAAGLPTQQETRDNPYGQGENYFENATEEGPNTGSTGQYPQFPAGPDPVDPLNSMFPMQPSAWTVPPNAAWIERPMQFNSGAGQKAGGRLDAKALDSSRSVAQSAAHTVLASAGYVDEGVQTGPGPNPIFFGGGSEGIGGDPQAGYSEDLAVQDPDDRANELYGAVPPQQSSGSGQGGAQPYSNPGVAHQSVSRVTSFFDPGDTGVRVVAQGAEVTDTGGGAAPQPPQSMMPGGVGSVAQPPLDSGPVGGDPMDPGGADMASKLQMAGGYLTPDSVAQAFARIAADMIRQRPTDVNPSGLADEYDERTWEGGVSTRPRQSAEDRGINTPQTPRDPIQQATSTDIQRELSEDEERLRQAARSAAQRVLAGAR